jgi:hypothetical protein
VGMTPPYLSVFGLENVPSGGVLAGAGAWSWGDYSQLQLYRS